jgi:hypothetical protein
MKSRKKQKKKKRRGTWGLDADSRVEGFVFRNGVGV